MSPETLLPGWYPLLRAADLRARGATRQLAGVPIRFRRLADSGIRAENAETGAPRPACEMDGWIFTAPSDMAELPSTNLLDGPSRQLTLDGCVGAALDDVGENILDTTHTSVVHRDYLRRPGSLRTVGVCLDSGEGWVSATYPPGAAPSGWGARLLGAHRYTIRDTFRAPGIAEVTYTEDTQPVFMARFWLTPVTRNETYVAATIAVPGTGPGAALKLAALRLFFLRVFAEDRAILERIAANRAAHGNAPRVYAPQDVLRPGIEAILSGRRPLTHPTYIELKV